MLQHSLIGLALAGALASGAAAQDLQKAQFKVIGLNSPTPVSIYDEVPRSLPALIKADKIQRKAARVGFDWKRVEDIFEKLQEEIDELRAAISAHADSNTEADHTRVREEIGDLLFVTTNIARHMLVEPEAALKLTNKKFRRRFGDIESKLREQNRKFEETTLDELEALWQEAKATQQ